MIQQVAFQNFRNYIKKRLPYAQYRVETTATTIMHYSHSDTWRTGR